MTAPSESTPYIWHADVNGGPIPSDDYPDGNPDETADCCGETGPELPTVAFAYMCTQPLGHDGPHVAYGGDLLAVWPGGSGTPAGEA